MLPQRPTSHQKKRLSKLLSQGETLVYVTGIGKRFFWINLFFLMFLPLMLTYVAIFMFFGVIDLGDYQWFKYLGILPIFLLLYNTPQYTRLIRMKQSYTYVLTNRRFLIIRGIFSRKIVTAPLTAITHVTVEQSFSQRFLYNSGHLVIITAGFDQREIVIENIGDPLRFKIWIEELTEKIEDSWEANANNDSKEFKIRSIAT